MMSFQVVLSIKCCIELLDSHVRVIREVGYSKYNENNFTIQSMCHVIKY